jgi:hypothetical protein
MKTTLQAMHENVKPFKLFFHRKELSV